MEAALAVLYVVEMLLKVAVFGGSRCSSAFHLCWSFSVFFCLTATTLVATSVGRYWRSALHCFDGVLTVAAGVALVYVLLTPATAMLIT